MIKNDPYELLKKEGIAKSLLSGKGLKALEIYDRVKLIAERNKGNEAIASQAEKAGEKAIDEMKLEITRIKNELVDEREESQKHEIKKTQSKKIMEKHAKTMDDLSICRERLREDRKRKIDSGEIHLPKKKTLTGKLRDDLAKVAGLIPEKLKGDKEVIKRTQKAVLNFLNELKTIWGINKIKAIEDELKEKFNSLLEKA